MDAPMNVVVALQVRSFDELNARIQRGESISQAELESKYLPLQSDYDNMASWLRDQGFSVTFKDRLHTNVIVSGKVSTAARAFGASFARVATADGEFTSAISAPSLPQEIAGGVLSIEGLQPHVLMHPPSKNATAVTNVNGAVTPSDVAVAYNLPAGVDGNGVPYTGTGQAIAILMDSAPSMSDLNTFWNDVGATFPAANFSVENVGGGATSSTDQDESNLDSEWVTAMAPGARVIFYSMPSMTAGDLVTALTQVETDGIAAIVTYSA
jgi:subtilase family serine protease